MVCHVFPPIVSIFGAIVVVSTLLEVSRARECLDVGGREAGALPAALERVFVMVTRGRRLRRIVVGGENFVSTNSTYAVSIVRCAVKYLRVHVLFLGEQAPGEALLFICMNSYILGYGSCLIMSNISCFHVQLKYAVILGGEYYAF